MNVASTPARAEFPTELLPRPSFLSRPFWEASKRHELVLQRCTTCGGWEWTPQMACSRCHTETLEWAPASGRGEVYAFSVVHRPQTPGLGTPYIVCIVHLDEGPMMLSDLVNIDPENARVGMPVVVAFEDFDDLALYHFEAVAA
jgi:uncharacterized protein